ncbi:MAG: SRPBCC family protein [Flavobacteriaceae bacterium]
MKYTTKMILNLPREEVIKKLDNPENMRHWQRGLTGYTLLKGTPGQLGAQMKLDYTIGKRRMSLTETIIENQFPSHFHVTYEAPGIFNVQRNFFIEIDPHTTQWVSETEFTFNHFGMKLMGWLMPGAFKKQSLKYLTDFKNFAEKGISVST